MSKSDSGKPRKGSGRRVRPLLLVLLWVWALCIFLVLDLFKNIDRLDRVRPESKLYEGMRKAAHGLIGEPYEKPAYVNENEQRQRAALAAARRRSRPDMAARAARTVRRVPRRLPTATDRTYLDHGTYAQWNTPGGRKGEGEYRNGRRHGTWTWKWPSGAPRETREYREGVLHGRVASWYEDGQQEAEEFYSEGRPEKTWTAWHANGVKAAVEPYEEGVLHGRATHWYDNEQPAARADYLHGEPQGVMTRWHRNGQKQEEGSFRDGKREGTWTSWDEQGRTIREERYEAGRRTR